MQGFNMGRYIPPDLIGLKSFNQASGHKPTNPKRNPDGSTTQTVRFECPFAIWCTTCNPSAIIGQGVRFNAQKTKVGSYYSTPVWSFRFKHTLCGGWIEVRTDPKNTEYVVVSGGRRRDDGRDKVLEGEMVIGSTDAEKIAARLDGAFGALEKNVKDKEVADTQRARVEELRKRSERDWADPYEVNRRVRREFRVERRQRQDDERTGEALQERFGLGVDVAAPAVEDGERARLVDFAGVGVEDADTTASGIFEANTKANEKEMGKRVKKLKFVDAAQQKHALQNGLKGNTRTKTDPFLKDEQAWHPVRRKLQRPSREPEHEIEETKPTTTTTTMTATLVAYDSD